MRQVFYPRCRAILHVVFDGFSDDIDDSEEFVVPVVAKACTIHVNSYKQADSYELTVDGNDLPIDPAMIRAGAADIYLFETDGLASERDILSRETPLRENPGGLIPRNTSDVVAADASLAAAVDRFTFGNRPVISGMFDDVHLESDSNGRWLTLQGQDYTAYLAGRQWPPTPARTARRIPVGKRLDYTIIDILAEADPRGKLRLVTPDVERSALPIVGEAETTGHGRGIPIQTETSYWDVLYKLAIRYGFILYVHGLDLVLARPKHLTKAGEPNVRLLRWGADIDSIDMSRKIGMRETVPTIIVQGYDPKSRQVLEEQYPPGDRVLTSTKAFKLKADVRNTHQTTRVKAAKAPPAHAKATKVKTTTIHKKDEYTYIPVYAISDRAILRQIAENVFHLRGRAERKVVVRTNDLTDVRDLSLLNLAAGDAVQVDFRDYNYAILESTAPRDAKIGHLLQRGYGIAFATAFVDHYDKLQSLRRPLRLREATYTYDVESGLALELELTDFVVVDDRRDNDQAGPAADLVNELRKQTGATIGRRRSG